MSCLPMEEEPAFEQICTCVCPAAAPHMLPKTENSDVYQCGACNKDVRTEANILRVIRRSSRKVRKTLTIRIILNIFSARKILREVIGCSCLPEFLTIISSRTPIETIMLSKMFHFAYSSMKKLQRCAHIRRPSSIMKQTMKK